MMHLFDAPKGFRFLEDGEKIEAGDIVCDDFGNPEFKISCKHREVGESYDVSCMPIIRQAAGK